MVKDILSRDIKPIVEEFVGEDGNTKKSVTVHGYVKYTTSKHGSFIEPQTKYYIRDKYGVMKEFVGKLRKSVLAEECAKNGLDYSTLTKKEKREVLETYAEAYHLIKTMCGEPNYVKKEIVGRSVCDIEEYDEKEGFKLANEDFHRRCSMAAHVAISKQLKESSKLVHALHNELVERHGSLTESVIRRQDHTDSLLNKDSVLVIHPDDPSTEPLKKVYEGTNWMVINSPFASQEYIEHEVKQHENIIIMGHGTPFGLLNPMGGGYLVDSRMVNSLKGKNVIGIWCNANKFFEKFGLDGYSTGMVISEVSEASAFCYTITEEENKRQFDEFCEAAKNAVRANMRDDEAIKEALLEGYKSGEGCSPNLKGVYDFNRIVGIEGVNNEEVDVVL